MTALPLHTTVYCYSFEQLQFCDPTAFVFLLVLVISHCLYLENLVAWTPDSSSRARKGLAWKCLKRWNAAVGVDEGKNATSANWRLSSTNDGK